MLFNKRDIMDMLDLGKVILIMALAGFVICIVMVLGTRLLGWMFGW